MYLKSTEIRLPEQERIFENISILYKMSITIKLYLEFFLKGKQSV